MKKFLLTISVIALAITLTAGLGFAQGTAQTIDFNTNTGNIRTSTDHPSCVISLSKQVSFIYLPDNDFTTAPAQSYAIATSHSAGDKMYGSGSDTTLIFWKANEQQVAVSTSDLTAPDSTAFNTDWTSM